MIEKTTLRGRDFMLIVNNNWLCLLLIFSALELSCADYITRDEFQRYIALQKQIDAAQRNLMEDTAAKLACNDRNVQDFVRRCSEEGSMCDTLQVTNVVSKMQNYHHRMLRLPYEPGRPLEIVNDDQKIDLVTMFTRQHSILPSTKLLVVAVPSHQQKNPISPAKLKRPIDVRFTPDIALDRVALVTRTLRNSFLKAPYGLSEKVVSGMEPQIPSSEVRSDELIRRFREHPANQLRPDEQKIRGPYIDFLIFMVDCQ